MKYIITKYHSPIIFSEAESHADVARGVGGAISAGMVSVHTDNSGELAVRCYGDSFTLNLKPAEGDSEIILKMLTPYY